MEVKYVMSLLLHDNIQIIGKAMHNKFRTCQGYSMCKLQNQRADLMEMKDVKKYIHIPVYTCWNMELAVEELGENIF